MGHMMKMNQNGYNVIHVKNGYNILLDCDRIILIAKLNIEIKILKKRQRIKFIIV